jgi:hypothetical protein
MEWWETPLRNDTCTAALQVRTWVLPLPARVCTLVQVDSELILWLENREVNHIHSVAQDCLCLLHGCCPAVVLLLGKVLLCD